MHKFKVGDEVQMTEEWSKKLMKSPHCGEKFKNGNRYIGKIIKRLEYDYDEESYTYKTEMGRWSEKNLELVKEDNEL